MKNKLKFKDKFMTIVYYLRKGENPPKEVLKQFGTEGFVPEVGKKK